MRCLINKAGSKKDCKIGRPVFLIRYPEDELILSNVNLKEHFPLSQYYIFVDNFQQYVIIKQGSVLKLLFTNSTITDKNKMEVHIDEYKKTNYSKGYGSSPYSGNACWSF